MKIASIREIVNLLLINSRLLNIHITCRKTVAIRNRLMTEVGIWLMASNPKNSSDRTVSTLKRYNSKPDRISKPVVLGNNAARQSYHLRFRVSREATVLSEGEDRLVKLSTDFITKIRVSIIRQHPKDVYQDLYLLINLKM